MTQGFVLFWDKAQSRGLVCAVSAKIHIHNLSGQRFVHFVGFEEELKRVAQDAFTDSTCELEAIELLKVDILGNGMTGKFKKSRALNAEEGSSAGLLFALLTAAEVRRSITGEKLDFGFAATGDISDPYHAKSVAGTQGLTSTLDQVEVHAISYINEKIEAALDGLESGDRVFYPEANRGEVQVEIKQRAESKNIRLIPIASLKEGIRELLGLDAINPAEEARNGKVARKKSRQGVKNRVGRMALVLGALLLMLGLAKQFWFTWDKSVGISINSTPEGATVLLDGEELGQTPLRNRKIQPGIHAFVLTLDGYQRWEKQDTLVGAEAFTFNPELEPLIGQIEIRSTPTGARVAIDERWVGTTPLTHELPSLGTHHFRLQKSGFEDWTQNIRVHESRDTLISAHLEPLTSLLLASAPRGASIFVDDRLVGTNVSDTLQVTVGGGIHRIRFEHPDYAKNGDAEFDIAIDSQIPKKYVCYFKRLIRVTSSEESTGEFQTAKVVVDGEDTGLYTPQTLLRAPGIYQITVKRFDYETVGGIREVVVEPALERNLDLVFKLRRLKASD